MMDLRTDLPGLVLAMLAHLKMNIFAAPLNPKPLSPLDFPQVSGNLLKEGVNSEMLNMLVTAIEWHLFYEPFKPSTFVCQPAGALIITKGGEIEIVSEKCSMAIATFPLFAGIGRTASMLDEELIILGNDDLGTK